MWAARGATAGLDVAVATASRPFSEGATNRGLVLRTQKTDSLTASHAARNARLCPYNAQGFYTGRYPLHRAIQACYKGKLQGPSRPRVRNNGPLRCASGCQLCCNGRACNLLKTPLVGRLLEADSFPINSPEGPRVLGGTGPPRFCRQLGGTSHSTTEKGYARLAGGPITLGAMPNLGLATG